MAPLAANGCVEGLEVDVAVVGGGVVGVLAGIRLLEKGIDFAVFERQADFGGVWTTHGNNHSTLQVSRRLFDRALCSAAGCVQAQLAVITRC